MSRDQQQPATEVQLNHPVLPLGEQPLYPVRVPHLEELDPVLLMDVEGHPGLCLHLGLKGEGPREGHGLGLGGEGVLDNRIPISITRSFGTLRVPPSSSCGGLVAFGHLGGPYGP